MRKKPVFFYVMFVIIFFFCSSAAVYTVEAEDLWEDVFSLGMDLDMILDTCSRVILLNSGRIAADGPASEILQNRTLLEKNRLELPLRYQK